MTKQPKTNEKPRRNIAEETHPVGRFMVMRHKSNSKSMHCSCVHETRAIALEEARRLCAEDIGRNGPGDACYYVLEISTQVGIVDGKLMHGV